VVVQFARDTLLLVLARDLHLRRYLARPFEFGETHAVGHVARDLGEAEQRAARVAPRGNGDVAPDPRAVAPHAPAFVLDAPFGGGDCQFARWLAGGDVLVRV